MQEAFSRLKILLTERGMSAADLVRKIAQQGDRVNAKSVYRLADPEEPLEKVDMRVVSAVCQALSVSLGDILTFEEPTIIEELGQTKQVRMDELMARHNADEKSLKPAELQELRQLIEEAEEIAKGNARRLANRRRRLLRSAGKPSAPQKPDEEDGDEA